MDTTLPDNNNTTTTATTPPSPPLLTRRKGGEGVAVVPNIRESSTKVNNASKRYEMGSTPALFFSWKKLFNCEGLLDIDCQELYPLSNVQYGKSSLGGPLKFELDVLRSLHPTATAIWAFNDNNDQESIDCEWVKVELKTGGGGGEGEGEGEGGCCNEPPTPLGFSGFDDAYLEWGSIFAKDDGTQIMDHEWCLSFLDFETSGDFIANSFVRFDNLNFEQFDHKINRIKEKDALLPLRCLGNGAPDKTVQFKKDNGSNQCSNTRKGERGRRNIKIHWSGTSDLCLCRYCRSVNNHHGRYVTVYYFDGFLNLRIIKKVGFASQLSSSLPTPLF